MAGEYRLPEAFEGVTPIDHEGKWKTSGSQSPRLRDLTLIPSAKKKEHSLDDDAYEPHTTSPLLAVAE